MSQHKSGSKKLRQLALLSVFWVPYFILPWLTGWSFASSVSCDWCWGDVLRHAFAMFGYGTIGCLFYAVTSQRKSLESFETKLWQAMGINVCFFIATLYLTANWDNILL
jgi:glucose uptake protein GlcU